MTITESILLACKAALVAGTTGATVYRSRTSSFGESELPAINIKPQTDEALNYANGLSRMEFIVDFEIHPTVGDEPDALADPVIVKIHQALVADATLKTLIAHLQYKARRWEFDDGDGAAAKVTLSYSFIYITTAI